MFKRFIRIVTLILVFAVMITIFLSGCTEADHVNYNMNNSADTFNCERRLTAYNSRTDTIILQMEGYMSLKNNASDELAVICKVGENTYKKNYLYLTDYILYVVEDISGTHADPYWYSIQFHVAPQIMPEIVP